MRWIVESDLQKVEKRLRSLTALKRDAEQEIGVLERLRSKIAAALTFLKKATDDVICQLLGSNENWKLYPQLDYISDMDGMF